MKKIIGWILFAVGIPYVFIAPTVASIQIDAGKVVFGGMSLQIAIGIILIGSGWALAHPKKSQE